jgi:hypothetical protein
MSIVNGEVAFSRIISNTCEIYDIRTPFFGLCNQMITGCDLITHVDWLSFW